MIMVVFPGQILHPGGGPTRAFAMAKAIRTAGFEIVLVSKDLDSKAVEALGLFKHVYVYRNTHQSPLKFNIFDDSYLARGINVLFDDFTIQVVKKIKPRAVICHFVWAAGIIWRLPPGIVGLLDTHDIQSKRFQVAREHDINDFDRHTSRNEEIKGLSKAHILISIQHHEKNDLLEMLPDYKVICVMHGSQPRPCLSPLASRSVLFVANYYDPNIRGIRQFLETGWDSIREAHPDACLDICGRVCEALQDYEDYPGIHLHGVVDDLDFYYKKASVVINSALYGTGLPIKTIEALTFGKCIVSNLSGVRGLEHGHFPGIICEDDEMAHHVSLLLGDETLRRKKESEAAAFAERYLRPNVVYQELLDILKYFELKRSFFLYFRYFFRNSTIGKAFHYPFHIFLAKHVRSIQNNEAVFFKDRLIARLILYLFIGRLKRGSNVMFLLCTIFFSEKRMNPFLTGSDFDTIRKLHYLSRLSGKKDVALLCAKRLMELELPENINGILSFIDLLAETNNRNAGLDKLWQLVEENREDFLRRPYTYGMLLMKLGDYTTAIECFLRADEENINFINARLSLSQCYFAVGLQTKALDELLLVLQKDPEHTIALWRLIQHYLSISTYGEAFRLKNKFQKMLKGKREIFIFNLRFYYNLLKFCTGCLFPLNLKGLSM